MSTPYQLSLLRRTFAALAAAVALGAISDAYAQGKVRLSGGSKNDECSYSSMSITPDGSVTVQCSGTGTTPPPPPPAVDPTIPGTFAMASATMTGAPNTTVSVGVTRTLGSLASTIYYWREGAGCDYTVGALNFAGGQMSNTIPTPLKDAGTTCSVILSATAPALLTDQKATTITIAAGTTPPPPGPISGCPTGFVPPDNMISASLLGLGNPLIAMQRSNQVISIPLPNLGGLNTGQVTFGESSTAATPQPVTIEISINKCPGLMDTSASSCNLRSTMSSYNSITWFAKAFQIITDPTSANQRGYCWAGDADQYYVNARWSYQYCPFGAQVCGFAVQYNQGPY